MTAKVQNIIIAAIAALLFGGGFWAGWYFKQCPNVVETVTIIRDSLAPPKDTTAKVLLSGKPTKIKVSKYQIADSTKLINHVSDINVGKINDTFLIDFCADTNYYEQVNEVPDSFKIKATAVMTRNELIDLQIIYQNFSPERIRIIERTNTIQAKQSLVKVYAGAYAGMAFQNKLITSYRGGVVLDAIMSDKHMIGINGGLNNFLQPEIGLRFSEKIRFK